MLDLNIEDIDWPDLIEKIESGVVTMEEVAKELSLDIRALVLLMQKHGADPPSVIWRLSATGTEYEIIGDPFEALHIDPSLYSIHDHNIVFTGVEGGTAWTDANTSATPKATDMDGLGADLIAGDTVSLATKSLEFDLSVAPGTVTVTLGTLTVDAGITLTLGGDLSSKVVTIASTGVLDTSGSNYAFTTTSACNVSGTLTLNGSTVSCTGTGTANSYSVQVIGTWNGGTGANHTIGSMAGWTGTPSITLTTGNTTFNNHQATSNTALYLSSFTTFAHANGTATFTYAGAQDIASDTARTLYNFTVNHASCALTFRPSSGFALTVANNLSIVSGSFTTWDGTTSASLTVQNATTVSGTLDCKASICSFTGNGTANSVSLQISGSGVFNGGTGANHTIGSFFAFGASTTTTFTSRITTINSVQTGTNRGFLTQSVNDTFNHGNGTVVLSYAGTQYLYGFGNVARTFYNLQVNNASCAVSFSSSSYFNLIVANNLTITLGSLSTWDGTTSANLTVTSLTSITGTLTTNASVCVFTGGMVLHNNFTNNGATITIGASLSLDASKTYANTVGTTTLSSGIAILGASATTSVLTNGGTWTWATCSIGLVDIQFDVTVLTGIVVTWSGTAIGIDSWTNNAGATTTCTIAGYVITGNPVKAINNKGTLTLNGTSGTPILISGLYALQLTGASPTMILDLYYVNITGDYYGAQSTAASAVITRWDQCTITGTSHAGFDNQGIATYTLTNCILVGNGGAGYNFKDLMLNTGASMQLSSCTFSTVGMQATSGWLLAKDGTGNYTFYGILASSETPDAAYRGSACAGTLTIKNADAYSTPFASSYTLGANMAATTYTTSVGTTFNQSTYIVTFTSGTNNGTWVMNAGCSLIGLTGAIRTMNSATGTWTWAAATIQNCVIIVTVTDTNRSGCGLATDVVYAVAHAKTSADITYAPIGPIAAYQQSGYNIYRAWLVFDTSAIPLTAIITAATVKLYVLGDYGGSVKFRNGQPTYPHFPELAADFDYTLYSGDGGGGTSPWTLNAYDDFLLNSLGWSWINKGGLTKLIMMNIDDYNGVWDPAHDPIGVYADAPNVNPPKLQLSCFFPPPGATLGGKGPQVQIMQLLLEAAGS